MTDVLVNGEDEQVETWNPLVHSHEGSPGVVFHWGVTKAWSQLSASVFCAVGCSTAVASAEFLSCCHQSLRFTREALRQRRQNQRCQILPSGKLMHRCRNCSIEYLVWTSVSFTSLSLSAEGSTSSASDHSGQDLQEAVRVPVPARNQTPGL